MKLQHAMSRTNPPHDSRLNLLAVMLADLGPEARAFGPTAAALHRLDGFSLQSPFHFLLPRGSNRQRVGHTVHTTTVLRPIDCEEVDGIPTTSPTRTLIDVAAVDSSTEVLTIALDSALRDLKTTEEHLHQRIAELRGKGRHGVRALLAAIEGVEAIRGGHSWLEREFLRLIGAAGLPSPATQCEFRARDGRLLRVDCFFENAGLVVELLGYRYHRTALQMQRDVDRMNQLLLCNKTVMQFTYADVVTCSAAVVSTMLDALSRRMAA